MKTTIPKLRKMIRKVITETNYEDEWAAAKTPEIDASLQDIINMCVAELQRDPDADMDVVCDRVGSMYGIPHNELQKIKDAVWRKL